jgi:hypothetical protein
MAAQNAGAEKERRVMDGDSRPAGEDERRAVRAAAGEVVTQRDDRNQADDADRGDHGLDDAQGHTAPLRHTASG